VNAYAGNPDVGFIAIDYGLTNTRAEIERWIADYGWTFPVGINDSENEIYLKYGFLDRGYDTFFVINRNRIITFIEDYGNSTADFPRIKQAIDAALTTLPVEPATWGRIKRLYQ
jgi:alkyl hydroperoxide reductase subunit AhpC